MIQPGNGEGLFWFQRFINLSLAYLFSHSPTYLFVVRCDINHELAKHAVHTMFEHRCYNGLNMLWYCHAISESDTERMSCWWDRPMAVNSISTNRQACTMEHMMKENKADTLQNYFLDSFFYQHYTNNLQNT